METIYTGGTLAEAGGAGRALPTLEWGVQHVDVRTRVCAGRASIPLSPGTHVCRRKLRGAKGGSDQRSEQPKCPSADEWRSILWPVPATD